MTDSLGPMDFSAEYENESFLGFVVFTKLLRSQKLLSTVDKEIKKDYSMRNYQSARDIIES